MNTGSDRETGRRSALTSAVFEREAVEQSIPVCFSRIVALYPNRLAMKGATREFTYDTLDREANRLAHAILESRQEPQERIAILAAQEAGAIAVLGVLKAGMAYVPLDPSYPHSRLVEILAACEIDTIVTEPKYLSLAQSLLNGPGRTISTDELDAGLSSASPDIAVLPEALAAIIYTSGSTGEPKGVMQTHRNILHRAMLGTYAFDIGPDDRVTLPSSLTYGSSLLELFATLLNGAAVYPFNVAEEGLNRLAEWLVREKLTIYHSVPTVWRQLTPNLTNKDELRSLRILRLGGDTLTASDVELYRKHYPASCTLFNSFSCSEAGLLRVYRVDGSMELGERVIPVGYALDDKEILVLDEDDQEVAPNEVGEIVISSEFLSPGYWKDPERTSTVFRSDPRMQGRRRYYSGDLGSLLPDGCLLYKGRKDSKTKIRGIGVETTQLEAALRAHPGVQDGIAVVNEDESGERRIAAYVVPHNGAVLIAAELRRFLSGLLPAHMLPASFVFLKTLPLTPGGKVDRQALLKLEANQPRLEDEGFIAPRDQLEQDLARICQSILGVVRVGVQDNLFALGMDSLGVVRLVTQLEKDFNEHIPPAMLLHSPTIALLAGVLRQKNRAESWSSLVPVQPVGSNSPLFWVKGDFSAPLPSDLGPDQPVYALDHQGRDGTRALHTTVETIAAHYLQEMRSARPDGPYLVGGHSFGAIVALEISQQLRRAGEKVELLVLSDPPDIHNSRLHFRSDLKSMAWKIYLKFGKPIPPRLRSAYILDLYDQARSSYTPQAYPGRAIVLRGGADWNSLLPEKVESGDARFQSLEQQLKAHLSDLGKETLH